MRMLACVGFLAEYFGHVRVVKLHYTEQFGSILSLEAGGLAFDMFQPKAGSLQLMVYSGKSTEIKLVCTELVLDDNQQIGPEALSAIKLRQEAITPEGRKKLLKLNRNSFGKLFQDLHPAQQQRRSQLLTERCMNHAQTPRPGPRKKPTSMARHLRLISRSPQ